LGHAHEDVAQEDGARGGGAGIGAGGRGLEGRELLLDIGREGRRQSRDAGDGGAEGGGVSPLGGDAAELEECGEIVGLCG